MKSTIHNNAHEQQQIIYLSENLFLRVHLMTHMKNQPTLQLHIGKIPVVAVGNSDGDFQMLEYVSDNNPPGKIIGTFSPSR